MIKENKITPPLTEDEVRDLIIATYNTNKDDVNKFFNGIKGIKGLKNIDQTTCENAFHAIKSHCGAQKMTQNRASPK